jgi:hypothetical protein
MGQYGVIDGPGCTPTSSVSWSLDPDFTRTILNLINNYKSINGIYTRTKIECSSSPKAWETP